MKKTNKRIIAAMLTVMMVFAANATAFAYVDIAPMGAPGNYTGGGSTPPPPPTGGGGGGGSNTKG